MRIDLRKERVFRLKKQFFRPNTVISPLRASEIMRTKRKQSFSFDLVDTTLRDGEQTAGVVFSNKEKIELIKTMDAAGIRWIEAGIPAMGEEERELLKCFLSLPLQTNLIAWNRAKRSDIKHSLACGFSYIHVSIPISDINLQYKLKKNRKEVVKELKYLLEFLSEQNVHIIVGTEDASRADKDFFLEIAELSAKFGACRIRYSDTVGCMNPFIAKETFEYIKKRCALPIEFHAHNDLGMATANSLAAYLEGVDYVSATLTGIGERAGNVCLEVFASCLKKMYQYDLNYKDLQMKKLTSLVEVASGRKIYKYRPIIGKKV